MAVPSSNGIQLQIVLDVGFLLALLHFVERRLRDVNVAALDEYGHLPVEKRQQQRSYVRAVDVRIRHYNDAVVAQFVDVEIVAPDAAAQRSDERADFGGRQHLVEARLLDVEDFSLERQDGLSAPVAALLGRAAGGIALDQEHLRERGIFLLAVGQFAGQARDVERALAPRHFARLARGLARIGGLENFVDDGARFLRMLQQKLLEASGDRGLDHSLDLRGHQLVLGLRGEFGIRQLHRQYRREPFARIIARRLDLFFFGGEFFFDVVVERAGESRPIAREVRAAVLLRNVVRVAIHALLIRVVPLHRHFHLRIAVAGLEPQHRGMHRSLAAIQVSDEGLEAAFVLETPPSSRRARRSVRCARRS